MAKIELFEKNESRARIVAQDDAFEVSLLQNDAGLGLVIAALVFLRVLNLD